MDLDERTIYIKKINEAFLEVYATDSIIAEISEFFSFYVPGYQFMRPFRMKLWSGKIYLYNKKNNQIYYGLLPHIKEFAKQREYEIEFPDGVDLDTEEEFSELEAREFADSLDLHVLRGQEYVPIKAYDHQVAALRKAIQAKRALLLSATSSGKTAVLYMLLKYFQDVLKKKKILVIVPQVSLVTQSYSDMGEYSYTQKWDVRNECHMIYEGKEKGSLTHPIYISTWHSLQKVAKGYFDQFDAVIVDECHLAKATIIKGILEKCVNASHRIGMTGTLDGTQCSKTVLEGLLGKVNKVITTSELIASGKATDLQINCLMLTWPEEICQKLKKATYQQEISFIVESEERNRFIRNLALSLKGNTLVLFRLVDRHGRGLYESLKAAKAGQGRQISFIAGETKIEIRDDIKDIMENSKNSITVASEGVFSVGINVRNIHNIIFASPSKGRIKVLQSIGRGLRKHESKSVLTLYDISDVLKYKSHINHTLKHLLARIKIYNSEKFKHKIFKVRMKSTV